MDERSNSFDVAIVGGGPGGIAAAIWCADLGLRAVLINDAASPGGQMLVTHGPVRNYPGIFATDGAELAQKFAASAEDLDFERRFGKAVVSIMPGSPYLLELIDGEHIYSDSVVIATGLRRRELGVQGEREFARRGILASGVKGREIVTGKKVVIVGGGDAALENADILGGVAKSVVVVHRRDRFSARDEFVQAARERPNVTFELSSSVTRILGEDWVTGVEVSSAGGVSRSMIAADHVLVRIGQEPNSGLVKGFADLDEAGYIRVGIDCETSFPGVFAVGDVANPGSPTIATAVGMGASAAKAIFQKLL